jgi:hypothetical protein
MVSQNDIVGGSAQPDPTLAWRLALSMAMRLLFNADVRDPMQAIAMLDAVITRTPMDDEDFGGMYEDVQDLAQDMKDEALYPDSKVVRRWT